VKRSGRSKDLTGCRFGRLVATRDSGRRTNCKIVWECLCDCGTVTTVVSTSLTHGGTQSCGCWQREQAKERARCGTAGAVFTSHGMSTRPVYAVYQTMIARCHDPRSTAFHKYGGRGIAVVDRWRGRGGFEAFLADMGTPPFAGASIDRIDNDGPYSPQNCRWATKRQQARNRRVGLRVQYRGEMRLVIEIAEEVGIAYKTLHKRLRYQHMTIDEAIQKPVRGRNRTAPTVTNMGDAE
jgi:hypothetical protein